MPQVHDLQVGDQLVEAPLDQAPVPAPAKKTARQMKYRAEANDRLRALRARRRAGLNARADAVARAMTAYAGLPARPQAFALRPGLLALSPPRKLPPSAGGELYLETEPLSVRRQTERLSRPPATQLIAERSRALPTIVSMLYVAQCEPGRRGRFENRHAVAKSSGRAPSWALLCGRYDRNLRTRRERMRRDLTHLGEVGLVALAEHGQGRYEAFTLNREDNADRRYVVPGVGEGPLLLSTSLITNGWHLVLEPDELALYLLINHLLATVPKKPHEDGVPLTSKTRFTVYGVSSEAYNAIHELEEFGLIRTHDPMPHRRRGKVRPPTQAELDDAAENEQSLAPVPYQLELIPDALERPALEVIDGQLGTYPLPPRVLEFDDILEAKYASVPLASPLKGSRLALSGGAAGPASAS